MNLVAPRALLKPYAMHWPTCNARWCVALVAGLLCSSLADVYVQYRCRDEFMRIHLAERAYRDLQTRHRTLLLEQGALLSPMRLMKVAEQKGMVVIRANHRRTILNG